MLHYYTLNEGTWRTTTRWPVAGSGVRRLYLAGVHVLTAQPPALADSATSSDTLRLDPTAGTGPLNRWNTNLTGDPVVYPNRAGVARKLLTYTTAPLRQATLVTGTPRVTLQVTGIKGASNGAIFVYLEDLSPDGRVTYLTEGDLALVDRAQVPARDNPGWAKLRTPRNLGSSVPLRPWALQLRRSFKLTYHPRGQEPAASAPGTRGCSALGRRCPTAAPPERGEVGSPETALACRPCPPPLHSQQHTGHTLPSSPRASNDRVGPAISRTSSPKGITPFGRLTSSPDRNTRSNSVSRPYPPGY